MFFPSMAYGAFCNRGLKNVLSFMQASGSEEEEEVEEERTGCGRQRAWKGRRSFVTCGEAGHKQGSQLPGLLIQHPQIKLGKPVMAAQGRGCISLAFLSLLLDPLNHISPFLPLSSSEFLL